MKKALILTLVLSAAVLGGAAYAAADIWKQHNQVTYQQNTLSGSPSASKGLTVRLTCQEKGHYFWDMEMMPGDIPETRVTGYRFSHKEDTWSHIGESDSSESSVQMDVELGFSLKYFDSLESSEIPSMYQELAADFKDGTSVSDTRSFSDLYAFYPMRVNLDLPVLTASWGDGSYMSRNGTEWDAGETAKTLETVFNDYFKIPVYPAEKLKLGIASSGDRYELSCDQISTDTFNFDVKSALTSDACYFTFDAHTKGKNLVDTSQISGGFGIYKLKFNESEVIPELSTVYPLDSSVEILELDTDQSENRLILHTKEGGAYTLTFISLDTMETIQKLEINDSSKNTDNWNVTYGDGWLIFSINQLEYLLISENDQGLFEEVMNLQLTDDLCPWESGNSPGRMRVTSDGSRIALVGTLNNYYFGGCDLFVQVYSPSGLQYHGEYASSLTCNAPGAFSRINSITVEWN